MINLIRNELFKIFHKKTVYIFILIGIACFLILGIGMNYLSATVYRYEIGYGNYEIEYLRSQKEGIVEQRKELKNCEYCYYEKTEKEFMLLSYDIQIKQIEFIEKYYQSDIGWIKNFINDIYQMNNFYNIPQNKKGIEILNELSTTLDALSSYFDSNDSVGIIEFELEILEKEIKNQEEIEIIRKNAYEEAKKAYAIESKKEGFIKSNFIYEYEVNGQTEAYYGQPEYYDNSSLESLTKDKKFLELMKGYGLEDEAREGLVRKYEAATESLSWASDLSVQEKQETNKAIAIAEYSLSKNEDLNMSLDGFGPKEIAINVISTFIVAFVMVILLVSSTIFSEEYSKGTIKFLFTTPNSRLKIFCSKFIAVLIMCAFYILGMIVVSGLIMGIFSGDAFMLFDSSVLYNYGTNTVSEIPLILNALIVALGMLPLILIVVTLSLLLSIITGANKLSYIFPMALAIVSSVVVQIMNMLPVKWFTPILNIMPFANWNFNDFMFGKIPAYAEIGFSHAIVISALWFIVPLVLSIIIFKRKDVRNI